MPLPRWFFPATRLTRELRKNGFIVEVERYFPPVKSGFPDNSTEYTVYKKPGNDGWRQSIGYYTSDLPWEGLRIGRCDDQEAAKIMGKYADMHGEPLSA